VSLLRYTVGTDDELVPYADRVHEKYAGWLSQQVQAGVTFGDKERWWLDRMVSVIASSAGINTADLDDAPSPSAAAQTAPSATSETAPPTSSTN